MFGTKESSWRTLAQVVRQSYGFDQLSYGTELGGLASQNVGLVADGAPYVLKRYGHSAAAAISRLEAIAAFLHTHQFCAPMPLPTRSLHRHFSWRGHFYALAPRAAGNVRHGPELTTGAMVHAAQVLARLHRLGAHGNHGLGAPARPLRSQASSLPSLTELQAKQTKADAARSHRPAAASQSPADAAAGRSELVARSLSTKRAVIEASNSCQARTLEQGDHFVHGDFHNENILFDDEDGVTCLLDFEQSFLGHGICDVAHFVFLSSGAEPTAAALVRRQPFVASYRAALPFSQSHLEAAVERHFLAMASSTFLEEKTLAEGATYAPLLQRDIGWMNYYLRNQGAIVKAMSG